MVCLSIYTAHREHCHGYLGIQISKVVDFINFEFEFSLCVPRQQLRKKSSIRASQSEKEYETHRQLVKAIRTAPTRSHIHKYITNSLAAIRGWAIYHHNTLWLLLVFYVFYAKCAHTFPFIYIERIHLCGPRNVKP